MPTFKLPGLIGLACCVVTAGCAPSPEKLAPAFPDTTLRHVYAQTLAGELQAGRTVLVTFAFGSAELDETAKHALDVQARWLAANGDLFFTITGSADRVGPDAMNRDLGLRRAQAVADYLVRAGVAASRISVIGTTGEDSPLLNTEDQTRLNRYVAISFLVPEGARSGVYRSNVFKDGPVILAVRPVDPEETSGGEESGGGEGAGSEGETGGDTGGTGGDTGGTGGETGGTGGDTGETGGETGGTGGETGGDTGGSTGGDTGGSTGGDTGGSTGGDTGGSTGGDTGGSTGGDTGGSTGGDTGGSTGGDTGGSTGGDTGGSTGGSTGGNGGNNGNHFGQTGGNPNGGGKK